MFCSKVRSSDRLKTVTYARHRNTRLEQAAEEAGSGSAMPDYYTRVILDFKFNELDSKVCTVYLVCGITVMLDHLLSHLASVCSMTVTEFTAYQLSCWAARVALGNQQSENKL